MADGHDAVLVCGARTPIGKFGGLLRNHSSVALGAVAVSETLRRAGDQVVPEHVYLGNVVQAGAGQNPARLAATRGRVPTTVPATTLNDVCLASMTSVGVAATAIRAGELSSSLVGGFESMSRAPHAAQLRQHPSYGDAALVDLLAHDGLTCAITGEGMGFLSDRVNAELKIPRRDQDEFAAASHARAALAATNGRLKREIIPVDGIDTDEGIRPDTSIERLLALRPAFTPNGTITAGNASQMSDAACAGLLMSREEANRRGLTPMVEVAGRAVVAGPDASLHLKPAMAVEKLLREHGMTAHDVDVWEINEAFAGVVLASARELDLDLDQVNVNGGAVALGHPLGASGFRLVLTLAWTMVLERREIGVAAICGGGGQGQALMLRLG